MPTPQKPHLALIGAGITGTTLSIALTRRGISHTLYEQSPHATELGAGLGFGPNASRAMKIINRELWEAFERVCTPRDLRGSGGTSGSSTAASTTIGVAATAARGGRERGGNGVGDAGGEGGGKGEIGAEEDNKGKLWIEFLDGTSDVDVRELEPAFRVFARHPEGHGAVHRAKWLEVLMGMVPEGMVQFGKRLEGIDQSEEKVVLRFEDGTTAEADAVVGCDGVKSKVREVLVGGREKQGAKCGYSGKYAYRCMIPMGRAVEEIGRARASVSTLWVS
jgi:salicylate hydroxylase